MLSFLTYTSYAVLISLAVCGFIIVKNDPSKKTLGMRAAKVQLALTIVLIIVNAVLAGFGSSQIGSIQASASKIDSISTLNRKENLKSGHLDFRLKPPYSDSGFIYVVMGGIKAQILLSDLRSVVIAENFLNLQSHVVHLRAENNLLLLSIKVFDIDKNIIGEVTDNNWRPNPNYAPKSNYDDSGFEVFDNKDRIAFNITLDGNQLLIHGVFFDSESYEVITACDDATHENPYGIPWMDSVTAYEEKMPAKDYMNKLANDCPIKQLFDYTGENWIGKRRK